MRIAYLDCFAGISGDMFIGALIGAGVPVNVLEDAVGALGLDASLRVGKVDRSGISSIKVDVLEKGVLAEAPAGTHEHAPDHSHAHEHARDEGSALLHSHPHEHSRQEETKHSHSHTHELAHPHADEDDHSHPHAHDHVQAHPREHAHAHDHPHGRSLTHIRGLIRGAALSEPVKAFALRTFELLGASEAKIHDVPVDQIHFHEVGAVDAIVDIVAASAGIAHLAQAGSVRWSCSSINVGGGMVECAHGTFPVPAPATADLLRGMPTYAAHVQKELVTPTGAALLRALGPEFGDQPPARFDTIGYGAGTRNPKGFPNVLRLSIGELIDAQTEPGGPSAHPSRSTTVAVLETAIDDANPQLLAAVAEQALQAGALDVMLTPVIMKKGRAGTLLTLLADPSDSFALERLLLRETTTLGIRVRHEERSCLERRHVSVSTPFGDVRIKIGSLKGEDMNAAPEFEDCRDAARAHHIPIKEVMQAAIATYSTGKSR